MIKPMLPTLHREAPTGQEWVYEVKYDGFRCLVFIDKSQVVLQSRNGKDLNHSFPEVVQYLKNISSQKNFQNYLPLLIDGELAILTSPMKADFASIQRRGRTKTHSAIQKLIEYHSAYLLAFDLLEAGGSSIRSRPYVERKDSLKKFFSCVGLPLSPVYPSQELLQYIPYTSDKESLWKQIRQHHSEGMIAKKLKSLYQDGKRTENWVKVKNYRTITCFITSYQKENGYFHVGVFKGDEIIDIGLFSHGISSEERKALLTVIKENSYKEDIDYLYVNPGICVELFYLEMYQNQLRHPEFYRFRFDVQVKECTWNLHQASDIPESVNITSPEKPLWENPRVTKQDYLQFLSEISPFILPFLQNRLLTVIRFPHGMYGESFYQKNCPDYAPPFVETVRHENIDYIVCNNLETLIWLGNQLAFEFHIPFQTVKTSTPSEIVFDLDPPSKEFFSTAITAALMMKEIFDQLQLKSFIKTSGRKGLQVYIPLPENRFTYKETRKFTEFVAEYLVSKEPALFTIERLKKNRGQRVYIDYIQHAEGKTIIAPYSIRGNDTPTVAAPLLWEEVDKKLSPEDFTIFTVLERIKDIEDPFETYWKNKSHQPFEQVLTFLQDV